MGPMEKCLAVVRFRSGLSYRGAPRWILRLSGIRRTISSSRSRRSRPVRLQQGQRRLEFEPAPKNSRAPVTERVESSLEIPETPDVALEKIQREEDDHSEDGNTPHIYGRWSTATDRT